MHPKDKNLFQNPTNKQLIVLTALWALGIVLLILSLTDLFTESIFQNKNTLMLFSILSATLVIIKLHINYWKNKGLDKL